MVPEPVGSTHLRFGDARAGRQVCDHRMLFGVPDAVGVLWVYQMSQRNWVAIKVYYRYLRKCLLG